jgi:regulator of CtrA degradation
MAIEGSAAADGPIAFGERLASSAAFQALFRDGMGLVEETAAYLDGDGREASRRLPRLAALAYASESMRLTTRLMQIASWLLLQRAINEGELAPSEAMDDKHRARAAWQAAPAQIADTPNVPDALLVLIERSIQLQDRIRRLDSIIHEPAAEAAPLANAIAAQQALLRHAFAERA